MSQYFMTLSGDVRDRYIQKISVIDNFDPYTFTKEHYNVGLKDLPKIDYVDIVNHRIWFVYVVNYFVLSHSYYTGKQLKSIKSLEAYKYYESGFVLEVNCTKVRENYVAVGKVKHSQRMNDTPLRPWVVILPEGDISSAHCNCMAVLGEVCSHTAALIFAIHFEQNKDGSSCTDKLCSWNVPKSNQPVIPQRVRDINWGKNISSFKDVEQLKVPPLSRETFHNFLSEVEIANPSAAILSVVQPFASQRMISNIEHLPSTLDKLYDTIYEGYSLQELRSANINLSISKEQEAVQKTTLKQSKSHNWFKYKTGRITASNFKLACKTSVNKPSLSLIKSICYPLKVLIKTKQVMYGINHEDMARKDYESLMKLHHQNLQITLSGLVISIDTPMFAASPDGLVSCQCCGSGCIEIKCPYRLLDSRVSIKNIAELKDSFLLIDENNIIKRGKILCRPESNISLISDLHCEYRNQNAKST